MTKQVISSAIGTAAMAFVLFAGIASAQTTTTTGGTTTPTVPNTGAGGNATANVLVLGSSALIALGGAAYLARKFAMQ